MKKIAALASSVGFAFSLSACGDDGGAVDTDGSTGSTSDSTTSTTDTDPTTSVSTTDSSTTSSACTPSDECSDDNPCPGEQSCVSCICVGDPGCEGPRPEGLYADCVTGGVAACMGGANAGCVVDDPMNAQAGSCFYSNCTDVCDCPAGPAGFEDLVACDALTSMTENDCFLNCAGGVACPEGMFCLGGAFCAHGEEPGPLGPYEDCVNQTGMCENGVCLVDNTDDPSLGACAPMCTMDDDCPDPSSGTATPTCTDFGGGNLFCELDCTAGTCPDGMACVQNSCFWEIVDPNAQPGFNDCANFAEEDACIGTEACVTVTGTPDSSVCAETCTAPADCPGAPATGTAVAACADIDGDAGAMECYLDCSADADSCPDNMVCVDDTQCMFQLQATEVFSEDFQGQSIPGTWTLHDEDGRTPAAQVAFIDAAWVASDFAQAGEFTAVSTSFYNPVGASDDWMVTPAIDLSGATNAKLRFLARSQDGNFRDSYEVHVNTTGPDVADFAAAAVLTVTDEFPTDFPRIVDLSAFDGNATVFIAIRNVSDDRYVLHVDDFRVTAD